MRESGANVNLCSLARSTAVQLDLASFSSHATRYDRQRAAYSPVLKGNLVRLGLATERFRREAILTGSLSLP